MAKTSLGDFKVTTPENSCYHNKRYKYRNPNTLYQPIIEPLPQYLIGLVL